MNYIIGNDDIKEDLLWWQKRGLQYTTSGFGRKIPTQYKVRHNNRWKRVYYWILSNSGILFVMNKGKEQTIHISRNGDCIY